MLVYQRVFGLPSGKHHLIGKDPPFVINGKTHDINRLGHVQVREL